MARIIKDVYTEYYSGKAGLSAKPTAIEFVAGACGGGAPLTRYIISDKRSALDLFKSGPLLQAIEERVGAGSTVIYAMRLAGSAAAKATLAVPGSSGTAFTLDGLYEGAWWNGVEVSVTEDSGDRTVEIVDPDTDVVYSFTSTSNALLVGLINAGQSLVTATIGAGGLVAALAATPLASGNDGLTLVNGDSTASQPAKTTRTSTGCTSSVPIP